MTSAEDAPEAVGDGPDDRQPRSGVEQGAGRGLGPELRVQALRGIGDDCEWQVRCVLPQIVDARVEDDDFTHAGGDDVVVPAHGTLRWGEAMLAALAEGGFAGEERAIAFRALLSYVLGAVQVEHYGPLSGPGTAAIARLPTANYPFLADTAGHARHVPPDVEFHRGLEALLRGLRAR
jgi:Tetracyclin repressor-like, C-terminal domain